jgi:multidrug efflux pump subunit AcrA (membrane-fusion protein)
MPPLIIKSPKATQVKELFVQSGGDVREGDPLISLYDYEEQKIIAQIVRAIDENQAKLAESSGIRIASKLASLSTIANAKLEALTQVQSIFDLRQKRYEAGLGDFVSVSKAKTDVALKTYQALQSALEVEIYQENIDDSLEVFRTIDLLLKSEQKYVSASIDRLTVKAPRDGVFTTNIFQGAPVRLGHLLGKIS